MPSRRSETFPEKRIKQFVSVPMGSDTKEADIVVYKDDMCLVPYILVECKKQEVSEAEFQQAIGQAYSYAFALPCEIKYVWVTSGIKSDYFEVDKNQNTRNQLLLDKLSCSQNNNSLYHEDYYYQ